MPAIACVALSLSCFVVPGQTPRPRDNDSTQKEGRGGGRGSEGRQGDRGSSSFQTEVPVHAWDIISGRPTRDGITLSIRTYQDTNGSVAYGTVIGKYGSSTPQQTFHSGQPAEVVIRGLRPGTKYFYRFKNGLEDSPEHTFMTARSPGSEFVFAIQADSHLDEGVDTDTYTRSLKQIAASGSDFLIDLGDTFMGDKREDFKTAAAQYVAQRYYFGIVGPSTPVFLTLGNHDGESGSKSREMFSWSNEIRRRYFPNPVPDDFYSGNKAGLQNYFSWEWGDALFVVLDPFSYTTARNRDGDNWNWTLGKEQYDWLKGTLEKSRAKYKFVFIHHLVGGGDRVARGGAEAARFWEWGGKNFELKDEFAEKRPGFPMPIHQLLVKNGVSAVFHGHDHIFAKQDLDGIVYQEVPQPGHRQVDNTRNAEEYGYRSGVIRGSSGILIVKVSGDRVTVSYVRSYPNSLQSPERKDGTVTYQYEISGRK